MCRLKVASSCPALASRLISKLVLQACSSFARQTALISIVFLIQIISVSFIYQPGLYSIIADDAQSPSSCSCNTAATQATSAKQADKTGVFLFVLIHSNPTNKDRREAIRHTWISEHSELNPNVVVKFSIGSEGISPVDNKMILEENDQYNDLLILKDLHDAADNATLKLLKSFLEINKAYAVTYLFKANDDTFALLNKLHQELVNRTTTDKYYWGFFVGSHKVNKKEEPRWSLNNYYLPYAAGGGYVISGDLLAYIVEDAKGPLKLLKYEDASVGVWLSSFKAERKHDIRFDTEPKSRGCLNVYMVSHKQSIEEMKSKYNNLKKTNKQCMKEHQDVQSYKYNWSVKPSQCCKRRPKIP
jgi:galactosylxylosylprotein 3-beta-galactosyltransferase